MTTQEISPTDPTLQVPHQLNYRFDIVKRSKLWFTLSLAVLVVGLTSMAFCLASFGTPLRLGLDFSGGTLLDLSFEQPVTTEELRQALQEHNLGSSVIQLDTSTSQEALIRMPPLSEEERLAVEATLREEVGPFERNLVETVGPTVGRLLLRSGILAVVISFGLIVVYLTLRFQLDYAVFAIVALLHDVVLTIGLFALLGLTVGMEVDSLFVVALLTIIGFSVNDTVVIYDRIRENLRLVSRKVSFAEVVNLSLNQTFARSFNTTLTTMLPLIAIAILGGATLKGFAIALLVGFALGVYSSIFIASPLLVWWRQQRSARIVDDGDPENGDPVEVTAQGS
ncbi:protein translocase subunit SecF [Thermostichus vulcanus]|uniref:Protein-export membrane protein SecF n=1 Tax=Thermostichus vulcanus str. 'Rupite' TaxID=2813851 RepID=A0ABT0C975_THEVL|nr:protein translocase subunit SecF [Thermostichus vulcanus]MCJ2541900.1 protein translocase subunit SecF [Thermostichus vulcanus str. 'Rupite']